MNRGSNRLKRVEHQIARQLAVILQQEVADPRVGMVTITAVRVSKDLEHAKIYFTQIGDEQDIKECQAGLAKAKGFIRSKLAAAIDLRNTPQLIFVYDESADRGARISKLIDDSIKGSDSIED